MKHSLRAHRDRRSAEIVEDRKRVLAASEHLMELLHHRLEISANVDRPAIDACDATSSHPRHASDRRPVAPQPARRSRAGSGLQTVHEGAGTTRWWSAEWTPPPSPPTATDPSCQDDAR